MKIHYVGGKQDEDEWLLKCSVRLRPPQKEEKAESGCAQTSKPAQRNNVVIASRKMDSQPSNDDLEKRPLRQSRITSGDARLAFMLQEQEVKATRKKMPPSHNKRKRPLSPPPSEVPDHCPPAPQNPRSPSAPAKLENSNHLTGHYSEKKPNLSFKPSPEAPLQVRETHRAASAPSKASQLSSSHQSVGKSPAPAVPSPKPRRAAPPATLKEKAGTVAFSIHADASSDVQLPQLKRDHMCLAEDCPIVQIKRLIVDEILPGMCASKIELLTPSGALVGQDHTLKYVRTVLWPRSRGELSLSYRLGKEKML